MTRLISKPTVLLIVEYSVLSEISKRNKPFFNKINDLCIADVFSLCVFTCKLPNNFIMIVTIEILLLKVS